MQTQQMTMLHNNASSTSNLSLKGCFLYYKLIIDDSLVVEPTHLNKYANVKNGFIFPSRTYGHLHKPRVFPSRLVVVK